MGSWHCRLGAALATAGLNGSATTEALIAEVLASEEYRRRVG